MKRTHALPSQLGAAARLGIEMILPLAAHENFAVLRYLEAFGEGFVGLHSIGSRKLGIRL